MTIITDNSPQDLAIVNFSAPADVARIFPVADKTRGIGGDPPTRD
jgi:hypothetical protein